ncbi:MAG TPA: hypothetical protein VI997_06015, partial [Candidatus Thermoplasmatota archaeon]|nr:hypothetical protein [Candidatus Thermoplasmatota archaeon]
GRVHGPTVPNNGINEAMCEIAVTLTPTPNAWGPAGAYVLTDRRAAQNYASGGNTDGYETDGRSAFNPYDDIAIDLIDEVDPNPSPAPGYGGTTSAGPVIVKNFVTSGPIVIKAKSAGCGGGYSGYENVYVPGGNRGFDIHMATDVFTSTFFDVGIQTPETVYDVDCLPRWDGAPSTCGSIQN